MEFVLPEQDQKDLVEASVDLELSRCYTQTYLLKADKETLQECFDNLMEYAQLVCVPPFGDLESEKCQIVEDYVRYLHSEMNPSVRETDPSRCAAPPRPVF
ncbi:hypothetical protein [Candidatus Nitrosocosmicus sp. FF01]|uniref:hypothetical protein n=1 Tax=Candidatus Nitrosocosmicus sp. FF01 TaxID=3397670 RepID=UPI0039EAB232